MAKQNPNPSPGQQSLAPAPTSAGATGPAASSAPLAPTNGGGDEKKLDKRAVAKNTSTLQTFLGQNSALLEQCARGFMTAEAMTRMATMAMSRNPDLARCTLGSILRALMDAAALRIRPGGLNGRGYLIPRKNNKVDPPVMEANFDPGWRGLVDVARRSKQIKSIGAQVVREGDAFSYGYHPLPKLEWIPSQESTEGRNIVAAFAVAELSDGGVQIEVLNYQDAMQIKGVSEAGKKDVGPWHDWPGEQWRKSVVKRLCKYLPVPDDSDDLERAMALSDSADIGQRLIDVPGEDITDAVLPQADRLRELADGSGNLSAAEELAALEREAVEAGAS